MPLKLSLKPGEKFVLNGAVVREKDIMQAEDADTPARRIYFPVMMMYLDEPGAATYFEEFASRLADFMGAVSNPDVLADCIVASKHVLAREYYKALMACRQLIDYESKRIVPHVPESLPERRAAG